MKTLGYKNQNKNSPERSYNRSLLYQENQYIKLYTYLHNYRNWKTTLNLACSFYEHWPDMVMHVLYKACIRG